MMVPATRYAMRKCIGLGLMILAALPPSAYTQGVDREVPLLLSGKMPLYPMTARAARVQGIVKVRVVTDGKRATSLVLESGPVMLASFTEETIRTWEFFEHKPTTFVATFEYEFESPDRCGYENGSLTLNLPLRAHIRAPGAMTCDPSAESKPH
jgi:hypothetical protein